MAQKPSLNDLLEFQLQGDPLYMSNRLNSLGGWFARDVTGYKNKQTNYSWVNAVEGEDFDAYSRDEMSYRSFPKFKSVVIYVTVLRATFDNIMSSVKSSFILDATLIDDPKVKQYKYSNVDTVLEIIEPFQPQKNDNFLYVFIVYNKQDYNNGCKIN
ncbi:MAG TPA: hypothetical protein VL728_00990 [Cyclobacteriaceae bacterium]|jgi:hypothetical protein|nr:hypothetical protein [Cyclobacteriaceae bacterium]